MKNFIQYLTESTKVYEFRIKIANCDPKEHFDKLKAGLAAWGETTLSSPKSLPITESNIDFPAIKAPEVYVIEATLQYPCTDDVLRKCVAEHTGIPVGAIRVIPKNHPEELWRNNEGELREYAQGEAVLDKPYEDNPEAKKAGDAYAKAESILKELKEPETVVEGTNDDPEGNAGKTTNELPTGTKSPVGSQQNKIPKAKK